MLENVGQNDGVDVLWQTFQRFEIGDENLVESLAQITEVVDRILESSLEMLGNDPKGPAPRSAQLSAYAAPRSRLFLAAGSIRRMRLMRSGGATPTSL